MVSAADTTYTRQRHRTAFQAVIHILGRPLLAHYDYTIARRLLHTASRRRVWRIDLLKVE